MKQASAYSDLFRASKQLTEVQRLVADLKKLNENRTVSNLIKPMLRISDIGNEVKSIKYNSITESALYRKTTQLTSIAQLVAGLQKSRSSVAIGNLRKSIPKFPNIACLPEFVWLKDTCESSSSESVLNALHFRDESDKGEYKAKNRLATCIELEAIGGINFPQGINSSFTRLYMGARDALYSNNVDRARHILSSLRELCNHLLRWLAPDASVMAWVSLRSNQRDLLHEGKPTRRARMLYILRNLNNGPFANFSEVDIQMQLKLFELLNRVHKLEIDFTPEQLRAIFYKAHAWISYMLCVSAYSITE